MKSKEQIEQQIGSLNHYRNMISTFLSTMKEDDAMYKHYRDKWIKFDGQIQVLMWVVREEETVNP